MRKNLLLFLLSIILFINKGLSQTHTPVSLSQTISGANSRGFYRYLPADYNTTSKNYPLLIWVHGAGQVGQGTSADLLKILYYGVPKVIEDGEWPASFTVGGIQHSFIVISPQFMGWPNAGNIAGILTYVSANYRVDPERIYLMGMSAGGGGIWDYASTSIANSDKIAAMIPFAGTMNPTQTQAGRIAASQLPIWAFHNTYDGTVPVTNSRNWVNYINSYVPKPVPAAKLTEFPVQSSNAVIAHDSWIYATPPSYKPEGINIYEWMLQYKRRTTIVNAAPVSRAGTDTSVILPATVTLNGSASTDADGIIVSYRWRKISGPASFTLTDSTAAITQLSDLTAGTYEFQLSVTDNGGSSATDNVVVNAFSVGAGTEQRVLIDVGPTTTASPTNGLYWNNITDCRPGIRVSNARTTQNLPSGINLEIINRTDGTYSPNSIGTAANNTTGVVGDYPANATVDLALVHSSGNGLWRVYGLETNRVYNIKFWGARTNTTSPRSIEIKQSDETVWQTYSATNNTNYNHAINFIVTGKTTVDFNIRTKAGSDFSAICVVDIKYALPGNPEPQPNQPPIANAGSNTSIQLPADSVTLNGCLSSDPENAALTYKWRKLAGPANFQIVSDIACQTKVRGLTAGTYQFELAVTDTGNLVAKDTVDIIVQQPSTPWPPVYPAICNDPYKIVVLGSSTAYGTGASPIDSAWARKLARYIGLQNNQSSIVNLAVNGYNSYHIMPTGYVAPVGRPAADTTKNITRALQQNPKAIIINLPSNDVASGVPVADIKANFEYIISKADSARVPVWVTTTQPRNGLSTAQKQMQVELKDWTLQRFGNKAVDFWTGFADANNDIAAAYSYGDGIHINNTGHHVLFVRMVEEKIWDSICNRKNLPPVANAGADINITGTSATVTLNGNGSYDPEGAALSYSWSIVAGQGATLSNSTIVNPVFTSSSTGNFTIVLTVTDNNAQSATDTLLISVLAPNVLPVANAGADIYQNIPPNTVQLNGSATDADGAITSYKWRKISGPSSVISNDAIANPIISSLVSGAYHYELTVTDNRSGTAKDSVWIFANAAPVAYAGNDVTITGSSATVQLNGSGSSDPEAAVLQYQWKIVSGTGGQITNSNTVSATFTCNIEGIFDVELKVTDPYGAFDTDTMRIIVAAANILPVANAGADILIHLPASSVVLNGAGSYDPDGSIATFAWRKITGPSSGFSATNIANPTVSGMTYGSYNFELTVTDNRGGIHKDSVAVIVNALPVANAGNNTSLTLPANSLVLNGSASSDIDGTITSFAWLQILGVQAGITNANTAQPGISFPAEGLYRFQLTVTDNRGAQGKDTVDITVLSMPTTTSKAIRVSIFGGTNPYNNSQWNNWDMIASLTIQPLKYDDGTSSSVIANITTLGLIADNGANYATTTTVCPSPVLRYTTAATSYRILTISGLSAGKTYNLDFFASRANTGNKTEFKIGNRLDTISTDNNINDYAKFTGLVPDNNGRIAITLSRIGTWHYLSAFVITEISSNIPSFARSSGEAESVAENQVALHSNGKKGFVVYPNPVKDMAQVYLQPGMSGSYQVSCTNIQGQVLFKQSGVKSATSGYTIPVNIQQLKKGLYIFSLNIGGEIFTQKIVKE